KEIKSEHYLCQECFWGNFSRSIILPPNLDTDDMKASFKRGVLNIEISKKDDQSSKTIRISN
ncbi:heat-shock protein, partial [Candidatus Peregrinibacteria bacterium CG_4_10_14_0_2_um_filter_41_8]